MSSAASANITMIKVSAMDKDTTRKVIEQNQKKIEKILRQNGVDPEHVPPLSGTYEERSRQRTAEVLSNNQKRINRIMRKYR